MAKLIHGRVEEWAKYDEGYGYGYGDGDGYGFGDSDDVVRGMKRARR